MMIKTDYQALKKRVLYILFLTLFILYGLFLISTGSSAGYMSILVGLFLVAVNLRRLGNSYVQSFPFQNSYFSTP